MFHVKPPGQNSVLNRYQPNSSQLHKGSNHQYRPPLPKTKPPTLNKPSHIPTKMQNLEPSIVAKFLQSVNGESPPVPNEPTFKSSAAISINKSPNRNKWKEKEAEGNPQETKVPVKSQSWLHGSANLKSPENINEAPKNVSNIPPWVRKPDDVSKPSSNASSMEIKRAVWSPSSESGSSSSPGNRSIESKSGVDGQVRPDVVPKPSFNPSSMTIKKAVWSPSSGSGSSSSPGNRSIESKTGVDWQARFEEAEKKRKELLSESQKAVRDKAGLERKLLKLENDYKSLEAEHKEKSDQLSKLSHVSEKVYQDYDKLNQKYEVETTALQRALNIASKWYQENKKLKRESIARSPTSSVSPLDELDGYDQDQLADLRKNVQELSEEVAQLQADLNKAKLLEFETQEHCAALTQQLEDERKKSQKQEKELKELRLMREKFQSVTAMVHDEVESLRHQRDWAKEEVNRMQEEAHQAKKERNVLAHQSTLLMGDIGPDDRLYNVLLEVEELKRKLEEEEHKHVLEMQSLQASIDERQPDSQLELLEEKLKLAESELQIALERAEQAEQALSESKSASSPGSGCAPPPPPPPPPMPMNLVGCNPPLKKSIHRPTESDSLEDMARLLGIERQPKAPVPQGGVTNDIINEIKGGKFTLRATEKHATKKEEQPEALKELLNIMGTLKRSRKNRQEGIFV